MPSVNRTALKFMGIGTLLLISWFLVIANLVAPFLAGLPPIVASLLYQSGIYAGLLLLSIALSDQGFKAVKFSIGLFSLALGFSVISAPYTVNFDGTITQTVNFWYASPDAGFGSVYQGFLPMWAVWFFVYIITPIILIGLIPLLTLPVKEIRKALNK